MCLNDDGFGSRSKIITWQREICFLIDDAIHLEKQDDDFFFFFVKSFCLSLLRIAFTIYRSIHLALLLSLFRVCLPRSFSVFLCSCPFCFSFFVSFSYILIYKFRLSFLNLIVTFFLFPTFNMLTFPRTIYSNFCTWNVPY